MRELESLTPKELAFCELYTCLGSETCSNASSSAKAAGYAVERNAGWRLMQRPIIREKIAELHSERMDRVGLSADKVLHDLEHTRILALAKGDLATACRCSELHGKTLALFADRIAVNMEAVHHYTEAQRIEAKRLARLLIESDECPALIEQQPAALTATGETEDERATDTE